MPAIFITATGTEIGKTYVAARLISSLRRRGRKVAALKPVISGFDPRESGTSDPALLLNAMGREAHEAAIADVAPWRFHAPLSPDMAAGHEGRYIEFDAVVDFCRRAIEAAEDLIIIEGIGGLMVPFNTQATVLDLIDELHIPILLVAGTYLGALSHTLTAFEAATGRGIETAALILNETPGSPVSAAGTRASLENFFGEVPIILLDHGAENIAAFEVLADLLS
ncbi:MAG TPA: dethiobiotin synthase [Methylovirgula sp.]|nr:dethiobiotin synthase [Methylovirgula sp.]